MDELLLAHTEQHVLRVQEYQNIPIEELKMLECTMESVYLSQEAFACASIAVGCTLNLVDEVAGGLSQNGVAVVR